MCEARGLVGVVECPDCGGEGEISTGMVGGRWDIDPPCETFRPCEHCRGHGIVEGVPDLIDEWDLDEIPMPENDPFAPPSSSRRLRHRP